MTSDPKSPCLRVKRLILVLTTNKFLGKADPKFKYSLGIGGGENASVPGSKIWSSFKQ